MSIITEKVLLSWSATLTSSEKSTTEGYRIIKRTSLDPVDVTPVLLCEQVLQPKEFVKALPLGCSEYRCDKSSVFDNPICGRFLSYKASTNLVLDISS